MIPRSMISWSSTVHGSKNVLPSLCLCFATLLSSSFVCQTQFPNKCYCVGLYSCCRTFEARTEAVPLRAHMCFVYQSVLIIIKTVWSVGAFLATLAGLTVYRVPSIHTIYTLYHPVLIIIINSVEYKDSPGNCLFILTTVTIHLFRVSMNTH